MTAGTGRVYITVNGKRVQSMPGATYTFGGVQRKAIIANEGVAGFQASNAVPTVDFTIPHTANVSAKDLQALDGVPLIFQTDTGVTITMEQASCTNTPVLSNGGLKVQFQAVAEREE